MSRFQTYPVCRLTCGCTKYVHTLHAVVGEDTFCHRCNSSEQIRSVHADERREDLEPPERRETV